VDDYSGLFHPEFSRISCPRNTRKLIPNFSRRYLGARCFRIPDSDYFNRQGAKFAKIRVFVTLNIARFSRNIHLHRAAAWIILAATEKCLDASLA
jgi:hypothetical protein